MRLFFWHTPADTQDEADTMATATTLKKDLIPPGLAWLTVFVPALAYFLASRFHSTHGHSSYPILTDRVDSTLLGEVFYLQPPTHQLQLQHPLHLLEDSLKDIVASVWKHDSELGRGYLLLSDARDGGRIWRWERGGGPIPIGKTLAMDPSGCRSQVNCDQKSGSGGLAVDFYNREEFREGRLVVAEWGEKRIVRLEDDSGARTPLVVNVPNACKHASAREKRVERPIHMLYTPFGDLLFMESSSKCSSVMRLTQAVHVPTLHSAMESRMAHRWNATQHNHGIDVIYKETEMKSMALDSTGVGLYVTIRRDDNSVLLVHLSLLQDNDDDDDDEEDVKIDTSSDERMGLLGHTVKMEFNFTNSNIVDPPQAIVVDEMAHVFLAVPTGVLVIKRGRVLGTLASPTPITSLTLGEDRYLYISTSTQLFRIRVRHGPPKIPTNQVKKLSTKA
jgi:hypothetical protein